MRTSLLCYPKQEVFSTQQKATRLVDNYFFQNSKALEVFPEDTVSMIYVSLVARGQRLSSVVMKQNLQPFRDQRRHHQNLQPWREQRRFKGICLLKSLALLNLCYHLMLQANIGWLV